LFQKQTRSTPLGGAKSSALESDRGGCNPEDVTGRHQQQQQQELRKDIELAFVSERCTYKHCEF
jgi:hypothetical protein